jgi:hypothetical protein
MKPLCQLCETRHENYQAHVFSGPRIVSQYGVIPVANVVANKKRKKYKDPEARKKYMRELMRKRRSV